jgi:hypothetical protein
MENRLIYLLVLFLFSINCNGQLNLNEELGISPNDEIIINDSISYDQTEHNLVSRYLKVKKKSKIHWNKFYYKDKIYVEDYLGFVLKMFIGPLENRLKMKNREVYQIFYDEEFKNLCTEMLRIGDTIYIVNYYENGKFSAIMLEIYRVDWNNYMPHCYDNYYSTGMLSYSRSAPDYAGNIKKTSYWPNRKIKFTYTTNEKTGERGDFLEYYSNGILKIEGRLCGGLSVKCGIWTCYLKDGSIEKQIDFGEDN